MFLKVQPKFEESLLALFRDIAIAIQGQPSPEVQLVITDWIYKELYPQIRTTAFSEATFLLFVFEASAKTTAEQIGSGQEPSAMQIGFTALRFLEQHWLSELSFAKLEQEVQVEAFINTVLEAGSIGGPTHQETVGKFFVSFCLQYFLENAYIEQTLTKLAGQADHLSSLIVAEFINQVDTIIQQNELEEGGAAAAPLSSLKVSNERIYRTLRTIQAELGWNFFNSIFAVYQSEVQAGVPGVKMATYLGKCLKLLSLSIVPGGANQMTTTFMERQELRASAEDKIRSFCSSQNLALLISKGYLEPVFDIIRSRRAEDTSEVVSLVSERMMAAALAQTSINGVYLLPELASQLPQTEEGVRQLIKLLSTVLGYCKDYEATTVQNFGRVHLAWQHIFQSSLPQELLSEAAIFYSAETMSFLKTATVNLQDSSTGMHDDSTFSEHLESFSKTGLLEILKNPLTSLLQAGQAPTEELSVMLSSAIEAAAKAAQNQNIDDLEVAVNSVCWLLTMLRVLFKQAVASLSESSSEAKIEFLMETAAKTGSLLLQTDSKGLNSLYPLIASVKGGTELILRLKFYQNWSRSAISKAFLTLRLPLRAQQELATRMVTQLGLPNTDAVFIQVLSSTILQLNELSSGTNTLTGDEKQALGRVIDQNLKPLVHLTLSKPYYQSETQSLRIRDLFTLDTETMCQLKDYLKQQLSNPFLTVDPKHQRQVIRSLMTLMCELNSASTENEILEDVFSSIEGTWNQLLCAQSSMSLPEFLKAFNGILTSIRGIFEGIYKQREYQWLVSTKLVGDSALQPNSLWNFIASNICSDLEFLSGQAIELKVATSKALLKLVREVSMDRNGRIDLQKGSNLMTLNIKFAVSCLKVLKHFDVTASPAETELGLGILTKALQILLQVGKHSSMSQKVLQSQPELRAELTELIQSLTQGLALCIRPSNSSGVLNLSELPESKLKAVFDFAQFVFDKWMGAIFGLCKIEGSPQSFLFLMDLVGQGLQSSKSFAFFNSNAAVDFLYRWAERGSKFYKESLAELLVLPETVFLLKRITKGVLRQFLKKEKGNMGGKTEALVKIIKMYMLSTKSASFFEQCAREIGEEYRSLTGVEEKLLEIAKGVQWEQKNMKAISEQMKMQFMQSVYC